MLFCAGIKQAALIQAVLAWRMQMACLALLHAGLAFPAPRLPADFQCTRRCIRFRVCCTPFVRTHSGSNGSSLAAVPRHYFCRLRQLIQRISQCGGRPWWCRRYTAIIQSVYGSMHCAIAQRNCRSGCCRRYYKHRHVGAPKGQHRKCGADTALPELGEQHGDIEAPLPQAGDVHPQSLLPRGRSRLHTLRQCSHGGPHRSVRNPHRIPAARPQKRKVGAT